MSDRVRLVFVRVGQVLLGGLARRGDLMFLFEVSEHRHGVVPLEGVVNEIRAWMVLSSCSISCTEARKKK